MHWITAIEFARNQPDVTYEEWCDLYYNAKAPKREHVEKAVATAVPIMIRNGIMHSSGTVDWVKGVNTVTE